MHPKRASAGALDFDVFQQQGDQTDNDHGGNRGHTQADGRCGSDLYGRKGRHGGQRNGQARENALHDDLRFKLERFESNPLSPAGNMPGRHAAGPPPAPVKG